MKTLETYNMLVLLKTSIPFHYSQDIKTHFYTSAHFNKHADTSEDIFKNTTAETYEKLIYAVAKKIKNPLEKLFNQVASTNGSRNALYYGTLYGMMLFLEEVIEGWFKSRDLPYGKKNPESSWADVWPKEFFEK